LRARLGVEREASFEAPCRKAIGLDVYADNFVALLFEHAFALIGLENFGEEVSLASSLIASIARAQMGAREPVENGAPCSLTKTNGLVGATR
jgi:hypothetical protein